MHTTRTIAAASDEHGHECRWCQDRPCVANVYLTTEEHRDVVTCCADCVTDVIEHAHHGDPYDVLVEISTATLPVAVG
jgi:hypothetical protein